MWWVWEWERGFVIVVFVWLRVIVVGVWGYRCFIFCREGRV